MARTRTPQLMFGLILVAVGGVLLASRFVLIDWTPALLLGLGLAFSILAVIQRSGGALIAGLLLLGGGSGVALGRQGVLGIPSSNWMLLCLGLAFVAIYLFGRLLRTGKHWWPLIPGLALMLAGGAQYATRIDLVPPSVQQALRTWWPAGLVILGAFLLLRALKS